MQHVSDCNEMKYRYVDDDIIVFGDDYNILPKENIFPITLLVIAILMVVLPFFLPFLFESGLFCLLWFFAIFVFIFGISPFYCSQILIDRYNSTLLISSGFFIPMKKEVYNLKKFHSITINLNWTNAIYPIFLTGYSNEIQIAYYNRFDQDPYKQARKLAEELASFLNLKIIDKESVGDCPACEAKFNIENPGTIICPSCETSLMMDGEGKLKIDDNNRPV